MKHRKCTRTHTVFRLILRFSGAGGHVYLLGHARIFLNPDTGLRINAENG